MAATFLGSADAVSRKDESEEFEPRLVEFTFLSVDSEAALFDPLEHCSGVIIMLRLGFAIDDDVVTQIFNPSEALESLADCVLKHLSS